MDTWTPGYVLLHRSGELKRRVEQAYEMLSACNLCARTCGVNRLGKMPPCAPTAVGAVPTATLSPAERGQGEGRLAAALSLFRLAVCRAGAEPVVASWTVHPWEEPPLSGTRGAGTIFFTHCTGRCIYCQNYSISQMGVGRQVTVERLAWMMLDLQRRGCHNIDFVTPTHYIPPILAALDTAAEQGLHIPLVWNTNGYDSLVALELLDGVIDIYLPDAKYADNRVALRLSGFHRYVEANRACLREMYRQMGDELVLDENGIARRGLIIRHLVLPGNLSQTPEVLSWIAHNLSPNVHVGLMNQYFPTYKAVNHPILGRRLTMEEYDAALAAFETAGLNNGWGQEYDDAEDESVETRELSTILWDKEYDDGTV